MNEAIQLSSRLKAAEPKIRAIHVSTYIPRECGIATYTKDLTSAINILNPNFLADIIAIDDTTPGKRLPNYPWEVKYKIEQENKDSWLAAAEYINQSGTDVVNVQHEFGICGGNMGEYCLDLLKAIKKPVVITLHTVLPQPGQPMKKLIKKMAHEADAVAVMINAAAERLVENYGLDPDKIVVIPHGVPDIPFGPTLPAKRRLNLPEVNIISTFGLMSPGKGYEYAIEAMPQVIEKHPKTKLLIIGETHPVVKRKEGESYRRKLERLVKKHSLQNSVGFINRYLSLEQLIEYLRATDIYITPYIGLDQASSGTLSYAIGAGKACISTPYIYAKEVIGETRGLLVEPNNPQDLAEKIINLLDHPKKRNKIAHNAYMFGRAMTWPNVALRYLDLFELVKNDAKDNS